MLLSAVVHNCRGSDALSMAEGQNEMQKLFKEYGATPFTLLKGIFIQGPIFVSESQKRLPTEDKSGAGIRIHDNNEGEESAARGSVTGRFNMAQTPWGNMVAYSGMPIAVVV
ncbi:hypothetical protein ES332_D11G299000v1 [Gossypium tomentosum]|nr:hypothetical protein ES332_D11G299000v1 [Gossypium tomentosum]